MITQNITHIKKTAAYALLASVLAVAVLFVTFFLVEPVISHGQSDTTTFRIRQTITDESSFLVNPTNVDMSGNLNGVTGGNATGTASFVVQTNNAAGYYVEIAFENNTTNEAMLGDVTASEALRDYSGDSGVQPSYYFTASTSSQFAYTVTSSTTSDTDASFLHNNADTCGGGGSNGTPDICWKAPEVAAYRIVDTITSAVTGASSTIKFKVHVPNAASPVPTAETYTATATLSLFVK